MNSRTSRPRSPTSAITLTSALVERAIMPSSEDLPTPEPAKMPRRCPRPQGTRPSSVAHAEPDALADARAREEASGARRSWSARGAAVGASAARTAIDGGARPADHQARPRCGPSRCSPTATRNGAPVASTRVPGPMPVSSRAASAGCARRESRPPRMGRTARPPVALRRRRGQLADLGLQAGGLDDQADQVVTRPRRAGEIGVSGSLRWLVEQRGRSVPAHPGLGLTRPARQPRAPAAATSLAPPAVCTPSRPPRPRRVRTTALPGSTRSVGLHVAHLEPLPWPVSRPTAPLTTLEVGGVDEDGDRASVADASQRSLNDLDAPAPGAPAARP